MTEIELRPSSVLDMEQGKVDLDVTTDAPEVAWIRSLSPEDFAMHERALRRKIDVRLVPPLFVLLVLNYLDRNALGASRVQGIEKSIGLVGNQFNVSISILYVGYILGQLPSNLILSRVRPSLYLPSFVLIWGLVSGLTAAVSSYPGLVLQRFFLGVVEAPYFPGSNFLLSSWYTKKELALRASIFYSGSLLASAFAGLITAGIQANMDGARGIAAWRWTFIINGAMTVAAAPIAAMILPDFPGNTRWLSPREKAMAIYRLERDAGSDEERLPLMKALRIAVRDPKLWVLVLITTLKTTATGVTQFIPTVVKTFHYSNVETLLLTAPPYLLAAILSLYICWSSDRKPERCWHNVLPFVVGMAGFIIAAVAKHNVPARYTAVFLMIGGMYSPYNVLLSWVGSTFARPRSTRAAAYAIVNATSNIANIWAPYLYDKQYAPEYTLAWIVNCVMTAASIICCFLLRWMLVRENKKIEKAREEDPGSEVADHFLYVL